CTTIAEPVALTAIPVAVVRLFAAAIGAGVGVVVGVDVGVGPGHAFGVDAFRTVCSGTATLAVPYRSFVARCRGLRRCRRGWHWLFARRSC
ncbi:MAG: hypothetical protein QOH99_178, partial [Frankiaceae bacterium]|nr:hypothetical protein [Frankiaceae bacterium]